MRSIDIYDRGAEIDPARTAVIDIEGGYALSFAELTALSFRVAAALRRDGIARQRPVAFFAPNDARVLVALLGLWRAAEIWVPINARNAFDANQAYMNYVRAEVLFYHSSFADEAAKLKAGTPSLTLTVCLDQPHAGDPSLEAWIAGVEPGDFVDECDAFGNLEDIVGIFATGGTTGPSKGVKVTNLGWTTMLNIAAGALRARDVAPVCLTTAPLTHAAGPMAMATLGLGATQVIMPGFDAGKVLANIEKYRVTHVYAPPTALYGMLDHPNLAKHDYSSLRRLMLVGSPVSPDKFGAAVKAFGPCLCQAYGQVECPMIMTWLSPQDATAAAAGDHPERLASCGRASDQVRLAIMDDDGNLMPVGERGEIVARGPLVSLEYFELPEATAEARRFGWHHTGDVGYRDADGYFFIVDRKKDMIVTGGFNVFSAEVEACVMELASVKECAVVGVPDDKWGEAIKAIVVRAAGADVDEATIIAHAKVRLGGVKAPKSVEFWDDIPKTPANKLDKKTIRSRYWGDATRMVN